MARPDKPSAPATAPCAPGGLSGADGYVYDPPDVDNYPFCWRDPASCGLQSRRSRARKTRLERSARSSCSVTATSSRWGTDPDTGDAPYVGLGKTDGWDDAPPTDCPVDANGAYTIPYGPAKASRSIATTVCVHSTRCVLPCSTAATPSAASPARPMPCIGNGQGHLHRRSRSASRILPPGQRRQERRFGDTVSPAPRRLPFDCVGMDLPVPQYLTPVPGCAERNIPTTVPAADVEKCDMKAVRHATGYQPGARTSSCTPKRRWRATVSASSSTILRASSTATAPTFGEKHAPPQLPVSVQDWTGREISRVYSDQFGSYNFLVPSTFTINPPFPSGVMPNMMVSCMNSPGPDQGRASVPRRRRNANRRTGR